MARVLYFVARMPSFHGNHGHLGSIRGGSQHQRTASWHLKPSYLGQREVERQRQARKGPETEKCRDLESWSSPGWLSGLAGVKPIPINPSPEGPLWLAGLQSGVSSMGH